MKCPTCGGPLKPSKKDPDYLLCYTCKKKFKVPQHQSGEPAGKTEQTSARKEAVKKDNVKKDSARKETAKRERSEKEQQKYSNIPPKEVRDKREHEMRKAYDEMLSVEDEKVSKVPIIVLAIAIIVVAAVIAYMLLK